ncbi:MAG: sigma-54-dependent Fis family transcriptional regulator [Ignavibacteria bacterium]|jgi:two-component system NtrC family response regulator|nr:sigma-54-dependent Fis family transcriptional regulator [Ignavibacteria bacterium]
MTEKKSVLIIDDEPNIRTLLTRILSLEDCDVTSFETAKEGIDVVDRKFFHVALVDVLLPDMNGIDLIRILRERSPETEVIVITAFATIHDGVKAIKNGAYDYIEKGKDEDEIIQKVKNAAEKVILKLRVKQLENVIGKNIGFAALTGKSRAFSDAVEVAKKVAATDTTVLLLGETGTGKELFAQAIHNSSKRKDKKFCAINCSAIPKDLQESELFGYVKGAFTGAIKDKKGIFEEADEGTIFLDEIGDMNLDTQAKFLRVLETNSFNKVGDTRNTHVNVRVISATNKDLKSGIEKGNFKNDLYYRLNTISIYLPALRERKDDLQLLINKFIENYSVKFGKNIFKANSEFISILQAYTFPGNIRELKNIIERALILCNGSELTAKDLPEEIFENNSHNISQSDSLKEIEKQHILKVYLENNHNKTITAEKLGIGSVTLYRKLKEYDVE